MTERRRHRADRAPAYRRWTQEDDDALKGLYVAGKSLADLAARLGFSEPVISCHMDRLELPKRARGRPKGRRSGGLDPDAEPIA